MFLSNYSSLFWGPHFVYSVLSINENIVLGDLFWSLHVWSFRQNW